MPTSLAKLAKNLACNITKFRKTFKNFNKEDADLVTRKCVYPYEYTNFWEKLEETTTINITILQSTN